MHQSRAQKISITSNATLLTDVSSMFDGLPGKVELISSLHTRIQGKYGNSLDYVIPYSILLSGEPTSTKSSCRSKVPTKILEENDSSLSEIDEDATNNGGHFQVGFKVLIN